MILRRKVIINIERFIENNSLDEVIKKLTNLRDSIALKYPSSTTIFQENENFSVDLIVSSEETEEEKQYRKSGAKAHELKMEMRDIENKFGIKLKIIED